MKIALTLPTNRRIKSKTAESILRMIAHSQHEIIPIISTKGFNTAENRGYLMAQGVKKDADYIMCVDDDMIYEEDTIDRLVEHDKDIVGGAYNIRRDVEKGKQVIEYLDGEDEDNHPLGSFKCNALGTGLLMIKADVFKKIPQPWFGYKWNDNGSVKMSTDWFFCEKAREHGYEIWCDTSITAGHIGLKTF